MQKILNGPLFRPQNTILVLTLAVIGLLLLAGSYFRLFENAELSSLDLRFALRPPLAVSDKIAIIEIGDDSIQKLGRFPFDRSYHALLTQALGQYGAKAVLFDIFFSESSKHDAEFQQAIKNAGNVYLPYVFDIQNKTHGSMLQAQGMIAKTLNYFNQYAKGQGHINVLPDTDGKYRKVPLFIQYKGKNYPYLSLQLVSDDAGINLDQMKFSPGHYLQWGPQTRIPLDEQSNMIVNYAGPWGKYYQHYSYVDVLRSYASLQTNEKPLIDLNDFRGKICLVGLTATGTSDLHPSPFASLYPALSIHADLINAILNHEFITRMGRVTNCLIVLFLIGLLSLGVLTSKPLKGFLFFGGLCFVYANSAIILFSAFGWWIDMVFPLLAMLLVYLICTLVISMKEWKKKVCMDQELQIARDIQKSFLPKSLPAMPGLDVAALMHTARRVGGDLYDFYDFGTQKLGVMIGDVSGKGIPASLFMTTVSGAFKFFALPEVNPQEALHQLNVKLTRESSSKLFVTMFYAIFDLENKFMSYANGGHLPVMYKPRGASAQFLDVEEGFPLGLLDSAYSGNKIGFSSGDLFVFLTDGITEARNHKANLYGNERIVSVVEENQMLTADKILEAIEKDVRAFEPAYKQFDDMTCIVVKVS